MSGCHVRLSPRQRTRVEGWMRRAIRLARRAGNRTWPNPRVGALVVRGGRVIGAGYHHRAGRPHAEIEALREAGPRARGADLIVTLEPCHHHGRTPPCTDAIAAAGLRRVYVGALDPNPRESGAGIAVLRRAGLAVCTGILEAECRALNEVYEVLITAGRPLVTLKAAVSLDGRLAARTGDARWISSEESRLHAHRLRARHEAVLIGAGTARADDPALDVRHVRGRNPAVVVLDTRLTLSPRAAMLGLERGAPVIVYCGRRAPAARARRLCAAGAEVVRVAQRQGRLRLVPVLADLLQRGCWRVLVEGGGTVIGALLAEHLADRMELAQAPLLLGAEAPPLALWAGPGRVAEAPRLEAQHRRRSGPDSLLSGRLVWPAG